MADEINRDSLDYTLGRIEQRLASGDKTLEKLSNSIDQLDKTISCLPCSAHDERLKNIEGKKTRHYSFADAIKLAIVSSVLSIIATLIIIYFTGGAL